jgi:hypothetical protein
MSGYKHYEREESGTGLHQLQCDRHSTGQTRARFERAPLIRAVDGCDIPAGMMPGEIPVAGQE